jgi:hypothetical protein
VQKDVVFEKQYIMQSSAAERIGRNGCVLRWCHRGVGRLTEETVGFPEWTAQFSVWNTTGNDSSEACVISRQNCAVYSVFPWSMSSHSKIALFDRECIAPFRHTPSFSLQGTNLLWDEVEEFAALNLLIWEVCISILSAKFDYLDRRLSHLPQHLQNNRRILC